MRYAADHKEKTRARILEAAGKVFRRQGYFASGVDGVMEEAGLTPGGFYTHFDSKQSLLAEALTHAGAEIAGRRDAGLEDLSGREWIDGFLERYLSMAHGRQLEEGCPLVALASEVSRAGDPAKASFEAIVRDLSEWLGAHVRECGSGAVEERVLAALAICVGGLSLARSVRDEAFARRILDSCRERAKRILYGETHPPGRANRRRGRTPE